jgi:hypothetical protein
VTTAAEWQAKLDEAFPAAVNVRIVDEGGDEDSDIDFAAPCLIALREVDGGVHLWFGSMSNNGKTFETKSEPVQVQETPFPRFEVKDAGRTFWFWPRPVPAEQREQLGKMKEGVRETARVYYGANL